MGIKKIKYLVVHCTATPEGRETTVADIDRWHKAQGWNGIGYHYVVYLDGTIHTGRAETEVGAHCYGHNAESLGICYAGGCVATGGTPKDTRTAAQRTALRTLLTKLKKKYPTAQIVGHRDLNRAKACPSFDARAEYADI